MAFAEKRGDRWRAGWWGVDGKRHYKASFDTKRDAMEYAKGQEADERAGVIVRTAGSFGAWAETWLTLRQVQQGTRIGDRQRMDRYILPRWGAIDLGQIATLGVQQWVSNDGPGDLGGLPLAPGTKIRIYRTFSTCLNAAVAQGRLRHGLGKVTLPDDESAHVMRCLEDAELDRITAELDRRWALMSTVLVGTGLRFGELAGLHRERVDLTAGLLDVVDTYDAHENVVKPFGKSKSKSQRTVPLASWVVGALEELMADSAGMKCHAAHRAGARCRSGLVIPTSGGRCLDHRNVRERVWLPALLRAGFADRDPEGGVIAHVRMHDLRHTYASRLVRAGVALQEVQLLLGHQSITTTERYAKFRPGQHDASRAALEAMAPRPRLRSA